MAAGRNAVTLGRVRPARGRTDTAVGRIEVQQHRLLRPQLVGVQRLVEEGADCRDVITQLTAAQAALHRVGLKLMSAGMQYCMTEPDEAAAQGMDVEAMEELFLKLR